MKIQEIEITDIGGIPYLKLGNLNPQINIICGANGVGKTNILESIARCFTSSGDRKLKKRSGLEQGTIKLSTDSHETVVNIYTFLPHEHNHSYNHQFPTQNSINLMYFKIDRSIPYSELREIKSIKNENTFTNGTVEGVKIDNIKSWFTRKELYFNKPYTPKIEKTNFKIAKECFSLLNKHYKFYKIDQNHDIYINTPTGTIIFEYVSSGFQSTLAILFGIMKEIEYRHSDNPINIKEYDGIVLIDEIELHLHPEWQIKICSILKKTFPKIQFFITTHSPHVIQSAKFDEVIALEKIQTSSESFDINKRKLPESKTYGFQGWTIEEILIDVMGMQDTRSDIYKKCISEFNSALEKNNKVQAVKSFKKLKAMLHPDSHIKKMLEIQMTTLE